MSNNSYATHLSPKDYNLLERMDYGSARVLKTNYAKRIASNYGVDYVKLENVLATVYGNNWHECNYNKLRAIAKAMPRFNAFKEYYRPEPISRRAVTQYRTRYASLDQTYAYRRAVRLFGKTRIKGAFSDTKTGVTDLANAVLGYRMVCEVEGKDFAKAMKNKVGTLTSIMRSYHSNTTTYYDKTPLDALPEAMRDDVIRLAKQVSVQQCIRNCAMPNYVNLAARLLDNVVKRSASLRNAQKFNYDTVCIEKDKNKLSKAIADMYALLELDRMLGEMGLEIDKNRCYYEFEPSRWSITRIEPKLVRAVKAVLATNYNNEAKQAMVFNIVDKLRDERRGKSNSWMLCVQRKATEETK